jgi:hypothetical protein
MVNMETKTIKTPIEGKELELKCWITGQDYEDIQKPITSVKMYIESTGVGKGEINAGEASQKSTEIAIGKVVVSVDGRKENILKSIREMRKEDYLFVLKEVDNVVKGKDFTQPINQQESGIDSEN